jgi:acetyl-CoA acetyltransferase family protein
MSKSLDIVIVGAKRTPFGSFGGSLKDVSANDLGVAAAKGALEQAGVAARDVEQVVFGNVLQTSPDAIYHARHVGLKAGCPVPSPALTVNRLCGSGFQAVISAAEQILLGHAKVVLAGGSENMSQAPHVVRARWGVPLGKAPMSDALWESLTDSYCNLPMALTAEKLATEYGITREQADVYALRSQTTYGEALAAGVFAAELTPVLLKDRRGNETPFERDECPRLDTTMDKLAKLAPVFKKDGIVTAGNASAITDGAAALVLTTGARAAELGLRPLARLVSWGVVGVDPSIMGIGPVEAIRQALSRAGLGLEQMDLIEVNEAFAPQYLAVEKALELDRSKTNVHGGAISLGHPLGASGARITAHLAHQLAAGKGRYAVGSACIGGGQGIAVVLEAAR